MSLATLALVLASALVHATWNLWTKQVGPSARSGPLRWLLVTISAVVYAPLALLFAARTGWRPDAAALGLIVGSGLIHVGYFLLLLRGYRVGDLSPVYPVARGTGPTARLRRGDRVVRRSADAVLGRGPAAHRRGRGRAHVAADRGGACGGAGASRIVAFITEPAVVRRILAHLDRRGVDARAGPWAGAAG